MPIILVTAKADTKDVVAGLEAGADEYLTKPVDQVALVARVQIDAAHQGAARQGRTRRAGRSRKLEPDARAARRRAARADRTHRPAQALSRAADRRRSSCAKATRRCSKATAARSPWCSATCAASRRSRRPPSPRRSWPCCASITRALGALIHKYEGTLERFAGDGLMVLFNDPLPCPDPSERAVRMAVEMRDARRRAGGRLAQARP